MSTPIIERGTLALERAGAASPTSRQVAVLALMTAGIALAFYLSARAAIALVPMPGGTFIWPNVGVAVAVLVLWSWRAIPGVFIGCMLTELSVGYGFTDALIGSTLTTLSAGFIAYVLKRILGLDESFRRVRDGLVMVAGAGLMIGLKMSAALIRAYAGEETLSLEVITHAWAAPFAAGAGVLIVTPLLLTWHALRHEPVARGRWIELGLLGIVSVSMSIFAFCGPMTQVGEITHLPYALFPIVFWAALRFDAREVTTVIAIAAAGGLWYTARDIGPFSAADMFHSQVALLIFFSVLVATGLLFTGAFRQEDAATEAVHDREKRLALLIDRMNEGLALFSPSGVFTYVSARFCELTEYPAEELIGKKKHTDLVAPGDRALIEEYMRNTREVRDEGAFYELQIFKRSGRPMTVLVSARRLESDAGEHLGILALVTDITETKRAQDALQASEAKYRLLVENQTDLVVRVGRDGNVSFASPSFRQFFGRTEEEILGKPLDVRVHEEDGERTSLDWRRAWDEYAGVHFENRVMTPHGWRWLAWSIKPVTDCAECDQSLIVVARDVTDRRRAEEQARAHLQQLAHVSRVASMGEMASAIAHEINQPLTAIANYANASLRFIRSGKASDGQTLTAIERVASEAERAGEIVRRMRSFVRSEEGQLSAVSPEKLVHDVMRLAEADARQGGIELLPDLDPEAPDVVADPIQIQQVLLNLVRNACDAIESTPTRDRFVHLRTRRRDAQGMVEITVTDTGPGLPSDKLEKVFEPFYTTKSDGVGIGLALSRSIIEAHGGKLWASAVPGRGATFHLTLPVVEELQDV